MKLCIYEDQNVKNLEPLTFTRPAFQLRCGAGTILERQHLVSGGGEVGGWVRPTMIRLARQEWPTIPVNEPSWLQDGTVLWANARWFPTLDTNIPREPHAGMRNGRLAYLVLPSGEKPERDLEPFLETWLRNLPRVETSGQLFEYLWELVDANANAIVEDGLLFIQRHPVKDLPPHVSLLGSPDKLGIAKTAQVEPFVTLDTRNGPVLIDEEAIVHSFSKIEGPCYLGKGSQIFGAKFRGGTLGPMCRVGGEFEGSIMQGYSNKYHDGFLGHSYVGEWVNLAAGTQTSDLRNDYEKIRTTIAGYRVATGRNKVGSLIGDHTKTGLGALLNTGSVIGAFCNILPSGNLCPQVVPSFCQVRGQLMQGLWDLRKIFHTAETVMKRRGRDLSEVHTDLFDRLYEETASIRRKTLHEMENKKLRKTL